MAARGGGSRNHGTMDLLYISLLLGFYLLISALALGCAHLQKRKAGLRQRSTATTPAAAHPGA